MDCLHNFRFVFWPSSWTILHIVKNRSFLHCLYRSSPGRRGVPIKKEKKPFYDGLQYISHYYRILFYTTTSIAEFDGKIRFPVKFSKSIARITAPQALDFACFAAISTPDPFSPPFPSFFPLDSVGGNMVRSALSLLFSMEGFR